MISFTDPTDIGRLTMAVLFLLASLKCFQVARKERVQGVCLASLGILFLIPPISVIPWLLGDSWIAASIAGLLMIGCLAAAMVLAITGLVLFQRRQGRYDRGRAQAIWAMVLGFLALLPLVHGFSKGVSDFHANQETALETDVVFAQVRDGNLIILEDYNLRFQSPGTRWLSVNPSSINEDARLTLTHRRPSMTIMVIPEIYGAENQLPLEAFGQTVRATLHSAAPGGKSEPAEPVTAAGISGEAFSAEIRLGAPLHYEFWYGTHQGLAIQVVAYGAAHASRQIAAAHRDFLANMELLDPTRIYTVTGDLIDAPLHLAADGISITLPENQWLPRETSDFPESAFRATALNGSELTVVRADLHGLNPSPDALTEALLALQGVRFNDKNVVRRRDTPGADGAQIRDLVMLLHVGDDPSRDYFRFVRRGDHVLIVNTWNEDGTASNWDPEAVLDGIVLDEEIPPLDYEAFPEERRMALAKFINQIGLYYHGRQDFPTGLAFFRRAFMINPEDAVISANRVEALWQMDELPEALEEAEDHLQKFPDHPEVLGDKARILAALERFDEAKEIYGNLFTDGFDDDDVLNDYINLLLELDEDEAALSLIEREAARRPTRKLRRWEGQVARFAGAYGQAETVFTAIAEKEGWDAQLFNDIILVFQDQGEHAKALEWLDRQEEQTGTSYEVWMGRGRSQMETRRYLEAHVSFTQALEARPGDEAATASLREVTSRREAESDR